MEAANMGIWWEYHEISWDWILLNADLNHQQPGFNRMQWDVSGIYIYIWMCNQLYDMDFVFNGLFMGNNQKRLHTNGVVLPRIFSDMNIMLIKSISDLWAYYLPHT